MLMLFAKAESINIYFTCSFSFKDKRTLEETQHEGQILLRAHQAMKRRKDPTMLWLCSRSSGLAAQLGGTLGKSGSMEGDSLHWDSVAKLTKMKWEAFE